MGINRRFIIFLCTAAIISLGAFFIPTLVEAQLVGVVITGVVSSVTLLGAAWYFTTSLAAFKRDLKKAYYLLAAGIVLYSFILLQFVIVIFAGLEDPLIRTLLFLVPYSLSSLFAYLGMRTFARLLDIKNIWTSFLFVAFIAIVMAGLATLIPIPPELLSEDISESTLDTLMALLIWNSTLSLSAGIVALLVRKTISHMYKKAVTWLAVALLAVALAMVHELIVKTYFYDSLYVLGDFSSWPFLLSGILFLRAGLEFRATQLYDFHIPSDASYVDIVMATAALVSKPAAVDKELDKVRVITSSNKGEKQLSAQDTSTLREVYLYLEEYLVSREPLSKFSREALRNALPDGFVAKLPKIQ